MEPGVDGCQVGWGDRGQLSLAAASTTAYLQPALPGGRWSRWCRAEHSGEAEAEDKNRGASKRWRRGWESPRTPSRQVNGEKTTCQDWHQTIRTRWPESCAEAHQDQRSAGRCLASRAARRAGHPGETHTAEREAEKPLSSQGWHAASTMLMLGTGVARAAAWARLAWHQSQCASQKGPPHCALPRPPVTPLRQAGGAGAHHLPLRTDVGPWAQDHQKPQLSCQVQEGFHVPIPSKVINPRQRLVVVPGDVAEAREEISTCGLRAPRHNGKLSHRLVLLLLGPSLQPVLGMATGAVPGLAEAHACVPCGQPSARAGPCSLSSANTLASVSALGTPKTPRGRRGCGLCILSVTYTCTVLSPLMYILRSRSLQAGRGTRA